MKKTLFFHLGAHFSFTFLYGLVYLIINPNWIGALGFCLSILSGFFIDLDHYLVNKPRLSQFWQALKKGQFFLGDPTPGRLNYLHSWWAAVAVNFVALFLDIMMQRNLGLVVFASFWTHFVIDVFDYENQSYPLNSPAPTAVHMFFWNRSSLFQKMCFNKPN